MKQPGLEELKKALDTDDPLNLVNAFLRCPLGENEKLPSDYWVHRFCALAEIIFEWKKRG